MSKKKTINAEIGEEKIPIVVEDFENFKKFVREGTKKSTEGICKKKKKKIQMNVI